MREVVHDQPFERTRPVFLPFLRFDRIYALLPGFPAECGEGFARLRLEGRDLVFDLGEGQAFVRFVLCGLTKMLEKHIDPLLDDPLDHVGAAPAGLACLGDRGNGLGRRPVEPDSALGRVGRVPGAVRQLERAGSWSISRFSCESFGAALETLDFSRSVAIIRVRRMSSDVTIDQPRANL